MASSKNQFLIIHQPGVAGKMVASYGTLVWDKCAKTLCLHDGVTPGGCACFSEPNICDLLEGLPDLGNICPVPPPPPPFNPCLLMASLPQLGSICAPVPPPPAYNPCAMTAALPNLGNIC